MNKNIFIKFGFVCIKKIINNYFLCSYMNANISRQLDELKRIVKEIFILEKSKQNQSNQSIINQKNKEINDLKSQKKNIRDNLLDTLDNNIAQNLKNRNASNNVHTKQNKNMDIIRNILYYLDVYGVCSENSGVNIANINSRAYQNFASKYGQAETEIALYVGNNREIRDKFAYFYDIIDKMNLNNLNNQVIANGVQKTIENIIDINATLLERGFIKE